MLGLLYKDFYTAKKELALTGFMALAFLVYNLVLGQTGMLGPTIGVLISVGSLVPTYSIHYDKVNRWNAFICASPLSRTKVVLSKYLAGLGSVVVMNLIIIADNLALGSPLPRLELPGVFVPYPVPPGGDAPRLPETGSELRGGGVYGARIHPAGHSLRP